MTMAKMNKNQNLEQRGGIWYFVAQKSGRRYHHTVSTSITEARRLRDQYLREIKLYGEARSLESGSKNNLDDPGVLFGELALRWSKIIAKKIKTSTYRDYRGAMNYYILPRFGNVPIAQISFLDIEDFIAELECSGKRINNILVPMRGVMRFAL